MGYKLYAVIAAAIFSIGGYLGYRLAPSPKPTTVEKLVYKQGATKVVDRVIERTIKGDSVVERVVEKEASQIETTATAGKTVQNTDTGKELPKNTLRVIVNPWDNSEFSLGYGYRLLHPISLEVEYSRFGNKNVGLVGLGWSW